MPLYLPFTSCPPMPFEQFFSPYKNFTLSKPNIKAYLKFMMSG